MPTGKYKTWRDKARNLEAEVARLKHLDVDRHETSVAYLLETAELFLGAARTLCEMRIRDAESETQ